jgi:predicted unusual protein kinase regulating ubiquinone biosynthesis (AarF/ABC1/UbiB family)
LQSSAHITKDEEVFATLSREFKGKWQDKLSIVYCEKGEMKVLGSGCVATVVKGTLRDDKDTPVAVKILHRGIQRAIDVDIDIMTLWASLVELLPGAKTLSLTESISEFSHFMKRQLDMQLEAESLEIFRKNFNLANSHNPRVHFPAPVRGLITENVLVESYIEGQLASTLFDADEATRKEVAKLGLSALLKMVFEDNYIHGGMV